MLSRRLVGSAEGAARKLTLSVISPQPPCLTEYFTLPLEQRSQREISGVFARVPAAVYNSTQSNFITSSALGICTKLDKSFNCSYIGFMYFEADGFINCRACCSSDPELRANATPLSEKKRWQPTERAGLNWPAAAGGENGM